MIVNSSNYETTADFLSALIETLSEDSEVYLNRIKYDLERSCLRADYFANILQYQLNSSFLDSVPFPGFENYVYPDPYFTITYVNGFATQADVGAPTTYAPGVTAIAIDIIPLNSNIVISGQEITLYFGNQEYTVTADGNNTASFSFTAPASVTGNITVTSELTNTASNSVAFGYHAMLIDQTTYTLQPDSAYGITLYTNNTGEKFGIGDANKDGTLSTQDLLDGLTSYGEPFRNKFTNFATVTLGNAYYYQGVNGSIPFTVTPTGTAYTFGTNNEGSAKTLDKVEWRFVVHDSDGTPNLVTNSSGLQVYTPTAQDLNADGSFSGSLPISADFNNPVLIIASIDNAYNTATLARHSAIGTTASITNNTSFNEGEDITITFADDSSNDVVATGSIIQIDSYATSDLELGGDAVQTDSAILDSNNAVVKTITLPDGYDKDVYFKTSYISFTPKNAVFISFENDTNTVDYDTLGVTGAYQINSANDQYYTDDADTITLNLTFPNTVTLSDYEITIFAVEVGSDSNSFTVTSTTTPVNSYDITPVSGNLTGTDSIRFRIFIYEA